MHGVLKRVGALAGRGALWSGWIASMALLYIGVIGVSGLAPGAPNAVTGIAPFIFAPTDWANPTWPPALASLALALLIGLPTWIATVNSGSRRRNHPQAGILVTSLLACGLVVVDLAIAYLLAASLPDAPVCFHAAAGPCFSGPFGALAAIFGFGLMPFLGALLAGTPAWVMGLIQTSRWRQWRWFWAIFFLSPFAAAAYVLFGANNPGRMRPRPATTIQASGVWVSVSNRE